MPPKVSATSLLARATALDAAGCEGQAIPLYRMAIKQGLTRRNLHAAYVGLGSSLQAVGNLKASVRVLQQARNHFPRDVTVLLFLALSHYHAGQRALAIRQLGDALLKESKQMALPPFRKNLSAKYHALR